MRGQAPSVGWYRKKRVSDRCRRGLCACTYINIHVSVYDMMDARTSSVCWLVSQKNVYQTDAGVVSVLVYVSISMSVCIHKHIVHMNICMYVNVVNVYVVDVCASSRKNRRKKKLTGCDVNVMTWLRLNGHVCVVYAWSSSSMLIYKLRMHMHIHSRQSRTHQT